jgi:2-C-methyl-D-erythritol 4-phosphate cytidylyltransferase/2-C-methyl-D-erythritol 2,4-cyclodiphosphate synthase
MFVTAILAAGGRGQRLGETRPKQLLAVGARTILDRSATALIAHPEIHEVVVALPAELAAEPPAYLLGAPKPVRIVAGGPRRQDSVANAFLAASPQSQLIVVHDAARPFASADLISRTLAAAAEAGAAVAALPARDTVKRGGAHHDPLLVAETLPRETIFLAQTPQAFQRQVLLDALALADAGVEATDEAALAERAGHPVRIVLGEATNIKITTREDLPVAEALARGRDAGTAGGQGFRIGLGYDLHRLVEGRPLVLGGVTIPFHRGLAGHSDADAVCHAVTDAVLGAVGAGDIGRHFPDTDPVWEGAASIDLLRRSAAIVADRGYAVVNVDVVVLAERPKLWPYLEDMRANLSEALHVSAAAISIKGKTGEGIGEIGRGEAMAVHATALVQSSQ